MTMRPKGLVALDISLNQLSDLTTQSICSVLRIGTPLEALNLRGNCLTRLSGKLLLDTMEEWATLKFVDLRDNVDNRLMGVLEEGQHLISFSRLQPPFWLSSPSNKLKRACYKASSKKLRGTSALEDVKPSNHDTYNDYTQHQTRKLHGRPRSAPSSTLPLNGQPRRVLYPKAPLIPSESKRAAGFGKNIPGVRSLDVRAVKQSRRRPSTSPDNYQSAAAKTQPLSSCSTSPEFAAWEHNDSNTKENRFPLQMTSGNAISPERNISEDDFIQTEGAMKFRPEEASVLSPIDTTKAHRLRENMDSSHLKRLRGAKPKPNQLKSLSDNVPLVSAKSRLVNEDSQLKRNSRRELRNLSPNLLSPPRVGIQTPEWNSFLKEITQAIFHLQERLDELIGPADLDSLAEQANSQQ